MSVQPDARARKAARDVLQGLPDDASVYLPEGTKPRKYHRAAACASQNGAPPSVGVGDLRERDAVQGAIVHVDGETFRPCRSCVGRGEVGSA